MYMYIYMYIYMREPRGRSEVYLYQNINTRSLRSLLALQVQILTLTRGWQAARDACIAETKMQSPIDIFTREYMENVDYGKALSHLCMRP